MLSRFVIVFLLRSKCVFMATVPIHSDFRAQESKICHCFHFSPSICCEVMELDAMILVFWMLNLSQLYYSPLSSSSRSSLVPLYFQPLEWYHLHIWGCWYWVFIVCKYWVKLNSENNPLLSIKMNEIMPFVATQMDLEIIILSEVNQRKTNIIWYHLYVEPKKKMIQMNLFAKQKQTHRLRK